ncbi:MAG: hypothetical protein LBE86_03635 [Gemmobacter sp.]|jgi:hypothetical protein|nr:hypothetical protein [Gemmobacter sp.]
MSRDYTIGALWIGGSLSYLEQLCLKSFVDAGQHIRLYTYHTVEKVPEGVEIADANEILPSENFLTHERTGSPALHSDLFRYHMLTRHDDVIWADTDAYCVKPFTTENGHFYAWESNRKVNGGVLGLPPDSETLRELLEFTRDEFPIPGWLTEEEKAPLRAAHEGGKPVHASEQPWGVWGPDAVTYFLRKTGEIRFALKRVALYPVHYRHRGVLLSPGGQLSKFCTDETFSIHLYGRRLRARILARREDGIPPVRSIVGRLLQKHGIDPAAAPLRRPAPGEVLDDNDDSAAGEGADE